MTTDEFFERLKKTGEYTFDGVYKKRIRRCLDRCCPIMAVYKDTFNNSSGFGNSEAELVGTSKMGLPKDFVTLIITAADSDYPHSVRVEMMRKTLLEMVGLTKPVIKDADRQDGVMPCI